MPYPPNVTINGLDIRSHIIDVFIPRVFDFAATIRRIKAGKGGDYGDVYRPDLRFLESLREEFLRCKEVWAFKVGLEKARKERERRDEERRDRAMRERGDENRKYGDERKRKREGDGDGGERKGSEEEKRKGSGVGEYGISMGCINKWYDDEMIMY